MLEQVIESNRSYPRLDVMDNRPEAVDFLKNEILTMGATSVADVGGGANPVLDESFVKQYDIDYALLDISQSELDKAPDYFRKVRVDLADRAEDFSARVGMNVFDIIYSHFFLEHVQDPHAVHRNIHNALKPGGLAIHFYPTPFNLPLTVNRLLPERINGFLLSLSQPMRDRKGTQVKFPAFYKMCGNPSVALHLKYNQLGFDVIRHTGYIGHDYYNHYALLRWIDHAFRPLLLRAKIPMTAGAVLVLRKKADNV